MAETKSAAAHTRAQRSVAARVGILPLLVLAFGGLLLNLGGPMSGDAASRIEQRGEPPDHWRVDWRGLTVSPANLILGIATDGTSRLYLVDLPSGQIAGTIEAGAYPMALFRTTQHELLVSDIVFDATQGMATKPRLLVLDLQHVLATKRVIPLPDRVTYTIFARGLALSADERFLYYLKRTDCGPVCDDYSVGVLDLDAGREIAVAALPRNCGFALLTPMGVSDLLVMCPELASLTSVSASGTVKHLASFVRPPAEVGPGPGMVARPIYGGIAGADRYYLIFQDGRLHVQDAAGMLVLERDLLAPPQQRFSGIKRWKLEDGRIILGFNEDSGAVMVGTIIVDPNRLDAAASLPLPPGARYLAPLKGGRIAVLQGGTISVLDVNTRSSVGGPASIPDDVERLVAPAA